MKYFSILLWTFILSDFRNSCFGNHNTLPRVTILFKILPNFFNTDLSLYSSNVLKTYTFHFVYCESDAGGTVERYLLCHDVILHVSHWWCSCVCKSALTSCLLNFCLWLGVLCQQLHWVYCQQLHWVYCVSSYTGCTVSSYMGCTVNCYTGCTVNCYTGSTVSAVTHVEFIMFIKFDIFLNCSWVVTRWQQYSTHLHTNSTQNDTVKQNIQNGTYITIRIHKHNSKNT